MTPMPHLSKIAVLGAGSWGTTFAKVLADAASGEPEGAPERIMLWARRTEIAEEITQHHTNTTYLGDIALPGRVSATDQLTTAVTGQASSCWRFRHRTCAATLLRSGRRSPLVQWWSRSSKVWSAVLTCACLR